MQFSGMLAAAQRGDAQQFAVYLLAAAQRGDAQQVTSCFQQQSLHDEGGCVIACKWRALVVRALSLALRNDHASIVRAVCICEPWTLISNCLRVPFEFPCMMSPLHLAAALGSTSCINTLLELNVCVDLNGPYGICPLFIACAAGQASAASRLLTAKACVNLQPPSGCSLLHAACQSGHSRTAILLVRSKALVDTRMYGRSPADEALAAGCVSLARVLKRLERLQMSPNQQTAGCHAGEERLDKTST